MIGRIASLSPDQRFVLVQSYGPWKIESGSTLTTRGPEGRTANLLVTGEKLGQYAAADIRTGKAAAGDAVYFLPSPATASTPDADALEPGFAPTISAPLRSPQTETGGDDHGANGPRASATGLRSKPPPNDPESFGS